MKSEKFTKNAIKILFHWILINFNGGHPYLYRL